MDKLQEIIRYNGSVATRAEAAEGLLAGGVPFAWVVRYLSDAPTLSPAEIRREARAKDRVRFSEESRDAHGHRPAAGSEGATKPPHEMTAAEFGATLSGRVTRTPAVGVSEWAKARGREADLEFDRREFNVAALIGDGPVRSAGGREGAKALAKKLAVYNAVQRDYREAVRTGAVPRVETVAPLDPADNGADAAHVRAMHKRAIYKAIGAGATVPPHVLAEYPGVADRAADKKVA